VGIHEEAVAHWVSRLWGFPLDRQAAAQQTLTDWGIRHILEELAAPNADAALGAILLVESVTSLVERGVPETKLLSKLRGDPDVWPTWAEIRAAAVLANHTPADANLIAEAVRGAGRHADLTFVWPDGSRHSIEIKALGLSDEEADFSIRMAPLLPSLLPRKGILTMHMQDTATSVHLNRDQRRRQKLEAERRSKYIHPVARALAASVIVGHGTEQNYIRRLSAGFSNALGQLSPDEGSWVAFHWSNGAPTEMVRRALATVDVPEFVSGVTLVGSVAIPGTLDNFTLMLPAPFEAESTGESEWHSDRSTEEAKGLLQAIDQSGGVRPSYVRVPWKGKRFDFIRRVGDRRILPCNLVLAPESRRSPATTGS
jgi:hypothetical protein